MGVPKFYRWMSERYPCLSEVVKEYQVPEFDNLYFDMNGIIHVCSHPNDDDPHFRISEEQIFKDIFHYIEVLFRIVRPRKVFFMAVDGVAPRAKMNQQRGRRFRSAKEAEENIKKALLKGEALPEEKRFDSNCITPGTKFMVRLQHQLEYMVKSKITSDPAWQGIRIYLSGHETPGEGEHKITEFIRHERMQPGYNPNTRHCLYGLDADLIMLGLCSHEPHFSLLREEVRFTGKKKQAARTPKPEETTFHLLHLSLMREYIDHEFGALKATIPFKYDLEAIIDDWVLMGFLVGNDFIPHLPHLHIAHNAIPMLHQTYIRVLPTLDGYLNEGGIVNLARFEKYLEVLSEFDFNKFEEVYADFKWLESKVGKKKHRGCKGTVAKNSPKNKHVPDANDSNKDEGSCGGQSSERSTELKSLQAVKELSIKQGLSTADSEVESVGSQDDTSTYELEFQLYKRNYYKEKLHFEGTDAEVAKIAYEYILAIQWICHYYYNGVQSWSWYYPFHYAPFLSDLRNLIKMKLKYEMGVPFLPYEQLLAVLPAASKECLPEPFWELMCSPSSPITDYYPVEFTCDLNGKQQEWEAVVLIPFINEDRLLSAMQPCLKQLNKMDKERNRHSGCQLDTFDPNLDYHVKSSLAGTFPDIVHCKAKLELIPLHSWSTADISNFIKGVLPGCRLSVFYPGFPTLHHLPHKSALKKKGVKVFQMPSRNENMILSVVSPGDTHSDQDLQSRPYKCTDTIDDVAENLLGTSLYVNWPHMEEAKVVAISDEKVKYDVTEHIHATGTKGSKHKMQRKILSKDEQQTFFQDNDSVAESYLNRRGIDIGDTHFLVYAQPLLGRKYVCGPQGQITLEKQWATKPRAYALQMTVKDISVRDPTFQQFKGTEELFPCGSTVFMLSHPYYGCQGKVTEVAQGMVSVEFYTPREPDIESVIRKRQKLSLAYYRGWELGSRLGISNYLVSRITGTIFVFYPNNQKWQVGLNLRFSRESCGVAGYTRLDDGEWKYSEAVERTLNGYMEKFPKVLTYLQMAIRNRESDFDAAKMVMKSKESDIMAKLKELSAWLKSLDCYHGDKVNEHSNMLESKVVSAVMEKVMECKKDKPSKLVEITLRPHVLYRPLTHQGTLIPDNAAQHRLLDRIVNVRDCYTVALGLRGTIIGIHRQPGQDALFDVVFDEEFLGGLEFGGRCPKRKGYRMPECAMVNISYGTRIGNKDHKPTAVVRPQNKQRAKQAWQSHSQSQFSKDRYPEAGKIESPRHARSSQDTRKQPRESQGSPFSNQPASGRTIILQKPNSSNMQSARFKTQAAHQGPSDSVFDTLWNTLKEQNKGAASQTAAANVPGQSWKVKGEPRAVQNSATETPKNKGKSSQQSLERKTAEFTSLHQAAKSLPTIQQENGEADDRAVSSSQTPTTSAVVATTTEATKQSTRPQQISTKPTTTVTQSTPGSETYGVDHLDNLFKKINVPHPQTQTMSPRLAFTPTQALLQNPRLASMPQKLSPNHMPGPPPPVNYHHLNGPPFYPSYEPAQRFQNRVPAFMQRPPYGPGAGQPPRHPYSFRFGNFGNRPIVHNPVAFPQWSIGQQRHAFRQPPLPLDQAGNPAKEGTQKLCEMLNSEREDASSSKLSTAEEDVSTKQKSVQKLQNVEAAKAESLSEKFKNLSIKGENSDSDSVKDEADYMERSTSVEDEKPVNKTKTKVGELLSMCTKCALMSPIYTYFVTGDEQVTCTVQLWNGYRFSSHPQKTRDKAMEEAAAQALRYLESEIRENRPVSTSPPTSLPYYVSVKNLVPPQYFTPHASYASPMPYGTASSRPYFVPPVPYPMMPQVPVVTIPSEYQQAAFMQAQYGLIPHHFNPYFQRYPLAQHHPSPTHQPKGAVAYQQVPGAKPVMWSGCTSESFLVQDKANEPRAEYILLDQPPMASSCSKIESSGRVIVSSSSAASNRSTTQGSVETGDGGIFGKTDQKPPTPANKKQNATKPKLAISFSRERMGN